MKWQLCYSYLVHLNFHVLAINYGIVYIPFLVFCGLIALCRKQLIFDFRTLIVYVGWTRHNDSNRSNGSLEVSVYIKLTCTCRYTLVSHFPLHFIYIFMFIIESDNVQLVQSTHHHHHHHHQTRPLEKNVHVCQSCFPILCPLILTMFAFSTCTLYPK